jgi:hypothetical protein
MSWLENTRFKVINVWKWRIGINYNKNIEGKKKRVLKAHKNSNYNITPINSNYNITGTIKHISTKQI